MSAQRKGLSQKEFVKYGKELGLTTSFLSIAWKRPEISYSIFQSISDIDAMQRGSCQTPRPAPRPDPGYWYCVGGEWEWVPIV